MDNLKYGVLVSGLVGIVACFLPYAPGITFWSGSETDMTARLLVLGPFAVGLLMAVIAVVKRPMLRLQSIIAAMAFGFVVFRLRDGFVDLIKNGGIGAKLMAISAVTGILFSIACVAKADMRRGAS